jgi:hypothetical protein
MYAITSEPKEGSRSQYSDGIKAILVRELCQQKISMRSAERLVFDTVSAVVKTALSHGVVAKASNISIIESLAWIFISYRSLKPVWFTGKQLRRFRRCLCDTLERIQLYSNESYREYSYCKYWLDVLLCKMARDPSLPERKEWNVIPLFSGMIKHWIDKAVVRQTRSDQMLILSLQKGSKKIWSNIDGPALLEKDADFKARLLTPRGVVTRELSTWILSQSRKVFRDLIDHKMCLSGAIPSHRVCWESSIRRGGAQALFSPLRIPRTMGPELMIPDLGHSSSVKITRPESYFEGLRKDAIPPESIAERTLQFGKLRGSHMLLSSWLQSTFDSALSGSEQKMVVNAPSTITAPAMTTNKVARITEAGGKIRYVSAGDGHCYTALRPLQQAMLKSWKRQPESTMLQDDLLTEVRRIDDEVKLPYWCSVDYEAATDLLKRDASFRVLEALLEANVPSSDLAWMSFGPGVMIMPDKSEFEHIEGQLMGHVLSFPMLCVINLAVYRASISRWCREAPSSVEVWGDTTLTRLEIHSILIRNVKINGDDMLFKCTKRMYEIFLSTCTEVGFKISQGKNYLSEKFCMINSQFYCRHCGTMERIGYLNLQLIKGFSSKKGESSATPTDIGSSMNSMIDLVPWARCTLPAALQSAEKKLGTMSDRHRFIGTNRSWFGHPDLGGYGAKHAPAGWRVTREQRILGAIMKSKPWLSSYRGTRTSPRMMDLINSLIHPVAAQLYGPQEKDGSLPRYTPSDEADLILMKDSKWFSRLLYYGQAAMPPFEGDIVTKVLNTFHKDHRLRPMSETKFRNYRAPIMLVSPGPDCPPLPPLLIHSFSPERYISSDQVLDLADMDPNDGWFPNH